MLDIRKYLLETGKVRVFKEIVTEIERYDVTLVREELVVDTVP